MEYPDIDRNELVSTFNCAPFITNNINWNKSVLLVSKNKITLHTNSVIDALITANIETDNLTRIGNIQSKHIMLLQFDIEPPAQKLLELDTIKIDNTFAYCVKPTECVDSFIHCLPICLPESELVGIFSQFGTVQSIREILVKHPQIKQPISSDRRVIRIVPKVGIQLTDLPYQISLRGFKCSV